MGVSIRFVGLRGGFESSDDEQDSLAPWCLDHAAAEEERNKSVIQDASADQVLVDPMEVISACMRACMSKCETQLLQMMTLMRYSYVWGVAGWMWSCDRLQNMEVMVY